MQRSHGIPGGPIPNRRPPSCQSSCQLHNVPVMHPRGICVMASLRGAGGSFWRRWPAAFPRWGGEQLAVLHHHAVQPLPAGNLGGISYSSGLSGPNQSRGTKQPAFSRSASTLQAPHSFLCAGRQGPCCRPAAALTQDCSWPDSRAGFRSIGHTPLCISRAGPRRFSYISFARWTSSRRKAPRSRRRSACCPSPGCRPHAGWGWFYPPHNGNAWRTIRMASPFAGPSRRRSILLKVSPVGFVLYA